jgi:tetratricopeptide (TPR) repeat protein
MEREVGHRRSEASTLNNIGSVSDDFGQKQKAIDFYNQAVAIRRAIGDRGGEANTLNNIGATYQHSRPGTERARSTSTRHCSYEREVGDRNGEAAA